MRLAELGIFTLLSLGMSSATGCSSDNDSGKKAGSGGSGGSSSSGAACKPKAASCYVAGPDGPGNECMAKADFSAADVTQLRLTSHQVQSPTALAAPFVQDSVITKKSALAEPECNLDGLGEFNLLTQVDTTKKEITIGGGVPQALVGPATSGTCWAVFTDPVSKLDVKQVTATYTESAGEISAKFPSFVMPIYVEDKFTPESAVLVPLHEMELEMKLSADKNCVGRYAADKLDPSLSCAPGEGEFAWEPAGTYQGYITVEEADRVMVVSLGETLCVVLTGDVKKWKGTPEPSCKSSQGYKDTGGMPKGDWCSTTNSAGGCQDSWKLVIGFSAQAIDIKGNYSEAKGGC
jgi:hypothetical protein